MFHSLEATHHATWRTAAAVLFSACATAILALPLPLAARLRVPEVIGYAITYVLLTFFLAVVAGCTMSVFAEQTARPWVVRLSCGASLAAPLAIFTFDGYLVSLALASAAAWVLARLLLPLRGGPVVDEYEGDDASPLDAELPFTSTWPEVNRIRATNLLPGIGLLLTLLAYACGAVATSVLLASGTTFLVAWRATETAMHSLMHSSRNTLTRGSRHMVQSSVTLVCAILLAAIGLAPYTSGRSLLSKGGEGMEASGAQRNDLLSGVILRPLKQVSVRLVAPPRHVFSVRSTASQFREPFEIPFTGEYWVLHGRSRPPESARVLRGDPTQFHFTGVQHAWLRMQARQSLPMAIDWSCCAAIDVRVRSTDASAETIGLELFLVDTKVTGSMKGAQSLGTRVLSRGEADESEQTLRFALPLHLGVRRFDEIGISFQLGGTRRWRSANVAIEGFRLIPGGMASEAGVAAFGRN